MTGQRFGLAFLLAGAVLGTAAMAADSGAAVEQANWHHVKAKFNYFGFTSHYTCDGIEGKVEQILELFGARKDPKVIEAYLGTGHGTPPDSGLPGQAPTPAP